MWLTDNEFVDLCKRKQVYVKIKFRNEDFYWRKRNLFQIIKDFILLRKKPDYVYIWCKVLQWKEDFDMNYKVTCIPIGKRSWKGCYYSKDMYTCDLVSMINSNDATIITFDKAHSNLNLDIY